ncbi:hypothetical protein [Flavobacterium sp.]|uniref:hypothetical protein n=1 Tax=Flavobacterium sp. TaxID=239 RepID=UPI0040481129
MKIIISTFALFLILNFQNTKKDIYFLYENNLSNIKVNETILIENQTFKIKNSIGNSKFEKFSKYEKKIITLKEFYKKFNVKNFDDLRKYNFYIFVPINKEKGKIYKIEFSLVINEPIE